MKQNILPRLCLALASCAVALFPVTTAAVPGDLYVSDTGDLTVYRYTPAGVRTPFNLSALAQPAGLAFDNKGNLYVAQSGNGTIVRFPLASGGSGGVAFASGLGSLSGLAFDGDGNLFAANSTTIFRITPAGVRTTFASGFNSASGLAFDRSGNLFVVNAEASSDQILRFAPDGTRSAFASGLNSPRDLAFDGAGNLYVTDGGTDEILKFAPDGSRSTFATGLFGPFGLAFDGAGNLFEASFGFDTIYKFTPAGARSTFASGGLINITFAAFEPAPQKLLNISTRGVVQTGDGVLIAGFIIGGNALSNNAVVLRARGPSLTAFGVPNALQDPTIELYNSAGTVIFSNNNWADTQQAQIQGKNLAPTDARESAILIALPAGSYTAIVRGNGGTTGIALVEVYDVQ